MNAENPFAGLIEKKLHLTTINYSFGLGNPKVTSRYLALLFSNYAS